MVKSQIVDYIHLSQSKKATDEDIKKALLDSGWSEEDITDSFASLNSLPPAPKPDSPTPTHAFNMWDTFEHILMFISMYVLAMSTALTVHLYIDKWLPPLSKYPSYVSMGDFQNVLLKGYLAALIVSFPLFAVLFLDITKRTTKLPALRNVGSRKTLIYFTLIMTFIFMIYSVTHTVYNLLSGSLTMNFILHFLDTVGISSLIFAYYFHEVKEDRKIHG